MYIFEDLLSMIAGKTPSRATVKGKRVRKGRKYNDERPSSESSSVSESVDLRQGRQRKKKQKIKINFSKAKAEERKECQKGSQSELEQESDDMVILHADYDSELVENLNSIAGFNNESEDKDSDSGLNNILQPEKEKESEK